MRAWAALSGAGAGPRADLLSNAVPADSLTAVAPAPLPRMAWRAALLLCVVSTADWYLQLTLFWIAASRGWTGVQLAGLVIAARAPTLVGGVFGGRMVDSLGLAACSWSMPSSGAHS